MPALVRNVSDSMRIMRLAISRRNANDPDSSDSTLFQYIQDFVTQTMSDDLKLFEQFGTLIFTIDETNTSGVYTFNDVGADSNFVNLSWEAFISQLYPINGSFSWNQLYIYQDPGDFFYRWGVNNEDILIPGYPTQMLFYGGEMTFRTIPNVAYQVRIYGYKELPEFVSDPSGEIGNQPLPFAYWMRYIAYGAALNYGRDYNFDDQKLGQITRAFQHEKKLLLTRCHNQIKQSRTYPHF